uniref:Uncharacterized protein n=1 Tax=Rhizophora mucronata TaxID=61149 RepID=A0A2P2QIJ3_RHIMU
MNFNKITIKACSFSIDKWEKLAHVIKIRTCAGKNISAF